MPDLTRLRFEQQPTLTRRTGVWHVHLRRGGDVIGAVQWRDTRYVFEPTKGTALSAEVLEELLDFLALRHAERVRLRTARLRGEP